MLQFFQWGILLQVLAVLHFIRRRPETFWLWVVIFFGPPGAFIYILMEVVPDLGLLRQSFEGFGRRKRIKYLEALVLQNPAAGNYEELGDLYLDEGKYDSNRALGLLAHAVANGEQAADAESLFRQVTEVSTLSETQYNYASFLVAQNRPDEARQWAERVLAKKPTMPRYLQRRERPWFRKAGALLKRLPKPG